MMRLSNLRGDYKSRRKIGMKIQMTNVMKYPEIVEIAFEKVWGELND